MKQTNIPEVPTKAKTEEAYALAAKQAEKLEDLAAEMRTLARNKLRVISENVTRVWQGESAKIFQQKLTESAMTFQNKADAMEAIARALRSTAAAQRDTALDEIKKAEAPAPK